MMNEQSWVEIIAVVGLLMTVITSLLAFAFYKIFHSMNRQYRTISDEELSLLLPVDADKSHLDLQRRALKKQLYFVHGCRVKPLPLKLDPRQLRELRR